MKLPNSLVFLTFTLMISVLPAFGFAKGPELKFTSIVTSVTQTDLEIGIVEISIQALDIPIIVNGGTEIEYHNEHIDIASISAGDLVKVRAFFSDEGITAEEIEVLETRFQRFHLSGVITGLDMVGSDTFIAVTGVEVRATDSTLVLPRSSNEAKSVDMLQIGDEIDVIGRLEDGVLQASSIHAGNRIHGEIEFDGTLLAVSNSSVTVEIMEGLEITAVLSNDSRIRGNLTPGAFVEVGGVFNSSLEVVIQKIAVDSDGDQDADDDSPRTDDNDSTDSEIGSEIALRSQVSPLNGKAEIRLRNRDGEIDQKFEVEIEDSGAGITYSIVVSFDGQNVNLGTFTTNSFGEASAEFEIDDDVSDRDLAPFLPDGMDVTDIDAVEILLDGVPILTGQFDLSAIESALDSPGNSTSGGAGGNSDDDNSNGDSSGNDSDEDNSNGSSSDNDNSNNDSIDDDVDDDNSNDASNGDDSDSSGDDNGSNDEEIEKEVTLVSIVNGVHGDADIRYRNREGVIDQKFQIEIEDAPADVAYSILVFFGSDSVDFGALVTNSLGEAETEYEIDDNISDRPLAPLLPDGKSVLDITTVKILREGTVVAEGSF